MRLESLLDLYLSHLRVERGLSPNTLSAYGADLGRFARFCDERGAHEPEGLDAALVSAYLGALARSGLGARSTARHLSALRGLMTFLLKDRSLRRRWYSSSKLPPCPRFAGCAIARC